ncbi:MAG: diacylglyceryl transferase, partial [Deltaproteobacteria bacterium]
MSSAFVVGLVVRRRTSPSLDLPRLSRLGIVIGATVGGALGAKVPWLVMDPAGLVDGSVWMNDGRTITFGLVGGYLGVEVAKLAAGVTVKTGDGFAVPLAVTIAIGRLGCFWAGCCFGASTNVPWGVDFGDGHMRHPTQLYEALFHFSAAVILYGLAKRGAFPRQR